MGDACRRARPRPGLLAELATPSQSCKRVQAAVAAPGPWPGQATSLTVSVSPQEPYERMSQQWRPGRGLLERASTRAAPRGPDGQTRRGGPARVEGGRVAVAVRGGERQHPPVLVGTAEGRRRRTTAPARPRGLGPAVSPSAINSGQGATQACGHKPWRRGRPRGSLPEKAPARISLILHRFSKN